MTSQSGGEGPGPDPWQQQPEEALHEQREWLRVTVSSIGDAVVTTDTEGRVTFPGTTGFDVWKRPLSEMLNTSVGVGPSVPPRGPNLLTVRTNPAAGPVEFVVAGTEKADAIEIFDIGGRSVDVVPVSSRGGNLSWHWSQIGCRPGVYLARLRSRSHETVRFVVVR